MKIGVKKLGRITPVTGTAEYTIQAARAEWLNWSGQNRAIRL